MTGFAEIELVEDEGESHWQLQGRVAAPGKLCAVTTCFENPDDEARAIETWKSVFIPPAEKEES